MQNVLKILTVVPTVSPLVRARVFLTRYIPELEDDLRRFHRRILDEAINVVKNKLHDLKFVTLLEEVNPSSTKIEATRRKTWI